MYFITYVLPSLNIYNNIKRVIYATIVKYDFDIIYFHNIKIVFHNIHNVYGMILRFLSQQLGAMTWPIQVNAW